MIKLFPIILLALLSAAKIFAQDTAVNFSVNDCAGNKHELYNELNAGKLVVISFVMPCGSCIGPTLSALTEVRNYAAGYPGRILFYLADDVANTSCATLNSWANQSGITGVPVFSNPAVRMSDYGSSGMPKIIVLGGYKHKILFTQNNGLDVTAFKNAITNGLNSGLRKTTKDALGFSLYPNPVNISAALKYHAYQDEEVQMDIYTLAGVHVNNTMVRNLLEGENIISDLHLDMLDEGFYFLQLSTGIETERLRFTVMR